MKKLVSVIMPVFNGERYLRYSIDSILSQTYKNLELIIVNDCSTDGSLDIMKDYEKKDERVRVFCNERNLKLPATLNVGFSHAKGDYFTWTSDDNMYKENALEVLVNELESNKESVMAYASCETVDDNGKVVGRAYSSEPRNLILGDVFGACFLYTAEVAKKTGPYDTDLFLAEDYDYWIRIYRNGNIRYINEDLYFYRLHEASLSETRKADIDEQTYKVLEKNFLFLYSYAKAEGRQYVFFDHIMKRCSAKNAEKVMKMLLSVDRGYIGYINKGKLLSKLRNSYPNRILRKIRGL